MLDVEGHQFHKYYPFLKCIYSNIVLNLRPVHKESLAWTVEDKYKVMLEDVIKNAGTNVEEEHRNCEYETTELVSTRYLTALET